MRQHIKQHLPAILLFLFFSSLYIYTAAPGVYDGDSGEMAAAVNELGLAHPTGFPLYMLAGKLFTVLFPIGDVAFRLNIFSALLTAIALILLFYALRITKISPVAAWITVLVIGLGKTIWAHAGTTNVYGLSLLFASLLLLIFIKWLGDEEKKHLYTFALVWGISLGAHVLLASLSILLAIMLWSERVYLKERAYRFFLIIFLGVVPLLQYLYIPFAYRKYPLVNLGDISSFHGFVGYITQRDYTRKIFAQLAHPGDFIGHLFGLVSNEISPFMLMFCVIGLFFLIKRNKKIAISLLGVIGINFAIIFSYGDPAESVILYRYLFVVYLALSFFIGYSLDIFMQNVGSLRRYVPIVVPSAMVVIGIISLAQTGIQENNRRQHYIVVDFARSILMTPEKGSILFSVGDMITGPLWYLQATGVRSDIVVIDLNMLGSASDWYIKNLHARYPDIIDISLLDMRGADALKFRLLEILRKNLDTKNIYIFSNPADSDILREFEIFPVGIINRIFRKGVTDKQSVLAIGANNWKKYELRIMPAEQYQNPMVQQLASVYGLILDNNGIFYAQQGGYSDAGEFFRKALEINPKDEVAENYLKYLRR